GERRQDRDAERLRGLDRHPLGQDRVDAEREVRVLLGAPERQHDPIIVLEVGLELHPVAIDDAHGVARLSDIRGAPSIRVAPAIDCVPMTGHGKLTAVLVLLPLAVIAMTWLWDDEGGKVPTTILFGLLLVAVLVRARQWERHGMPQSAGPNPPLWL